MSIIGAGSRIFFSLFPILFAIVFFFVAFTIFRTILRNSRQWNANNAAPRLTVPARVVAKRTQNSGFRCDMPMRGTSYYITFEVDSGDRMELSMEGEDFGLLAEGDVGLLTFQGSRYLGFDRSR